MKFIKFYFNLVILFFGLLISTVSLFANSNSWNEIKKLPLIIQLKMTGSAIQSPLIMKRQLSARNLMTPG